MLLGLLVFLPILNGLPVMGNQVGVLDQRNGTSPSRTSDNSLNFPSNISSWSSLRGVNYEWTSFSDPNMSLSASPSPSVSFPEIKKNGWNFIRVDLFWNVYVLNPSQFIQNVQTIGWYAQENGLYIMWDLNHQSQTGSQFEVNGTDGIGMPTFLTSPYSTQSAFWTAWWANQTLYNGRSGWQLDLQYDIQIIKAVDNYSSTSGYEIMNEPPIYSSTGTTAGFYNFQGFQQFSNYIGEGLRTQTSKTIFFMIPYTKPYLLNSCFSSCLLDSYPSKISNIALDIHVYDVYDPTLLRQFALFSQDVGAPVVVGEWGPCAGDNSSCTASETYIGQFIHTYVTSFESYGWGWSYWRWNEGSTGALGLWQNLLNHTGGQWWLDDEIVNVQTQIYTSSSLSTSITLIPAIGSQQISVTNYFMINFTQGGFPTSLPYTGTTIQIQADPLAPIMVSGKSSASSSSEEWCLLSSCSSIVLNSSSTANVTRYYYDLLAQSVSVSSESSLPSSPKLLYATAPPISSNSGSLTNETAILTASPYTIWTQRDSRVATSSIVISPNQESWNATPNLWTITTSHQINSPIVYGKDFYLTMQSNLNSSLTATPQPGWYPSGKVLAILANATKGYQFESWTGSGIGSYTGNININKIIMNGPINETANFAQAVISPATRNLTFVATNFPTGAKWGIVVGTTSEGLTQYSQNDSIIFTGLAQGNYVWTIIDPSTKNRIRFVANESSGAISIGPSNIYRTILFTPEFYVAVNSPFGSASGSGWYQAGSSVAFGIGTRNISTGKGVEESFSSWACAGNGCYSGNQSELNLTVNNALNETANWQTKYYLSTNSTSAGTVFPSSGWHNAGATVSLSESNNASYIFSNWKGTGSGSYSGTLENTSIVIDAPISEYAVFTSLNSMISFTENGLQKGTTWSVTLGNVTLTSNGSSIAFNYFGRGNLSWTTNVQQPNIPGTQIASLTPGGSISLPTDKSLAVHFQEQYWVVFAVGHSGDSLSTLLESNWFAAGETVPLYGANETDYGFSQWLTNSSLLVVSNSSSVNSTLIVGGSGTVTEELVPFHTSYVATLSNAVSMMIGILEKVSLQWQPFAPIVTSCSIFLAGSLIMRRRNISRHH